MNCTRQSGGHLKIISWLPSLLASPSILSRTWITHIQERAASDLSPDVTYASPNHCSSNSQHSEQHHHQHQQQQILLQQHQQQASCASQFEMPPNSNSVLAAQSQQFVIKGRIITWTLPSHSPVIIVHKACHHAVSIPPRHGPHVEGHSVLSSQPHTKACCPHCKETSVECEYAYDISVVLDDGTGHLTASLVSSAAHAALQVQKTKTLFIKNVALPPPP